MKLKEWMGMGLILVACGCGGTVRELDKPVEVKGKVSWKGQAVQGLAVALQPLEEGHMAQLEIAADNTIKGEATPGKYAYFLGPGKGSKSNAVAQIPSKYREPDLNRTVTVEPGRDIEIVID